MFSRDNKEVTEVWQSVADELELDFANTANPSLTGTHGGKPVAIKVFEEKKASVSRLYTGFELFHQYAFHTSFELTRQGMIQIFADMVGARDIQIGDPRFDSRVMVKGWNEDVVRHLYQSDSVRDTTLSLFENSRYQQVRICHNSIFVTVSGNIVRRFEAGMILEQMAKLSGLLIEEDRQFDTGEVVEEVIEAPVEPPVEPEPVEDAQPAPEPEPVPEAPAPTGVEDLLAKLKQHDFDENFKGRKVSWKQEPGHIIPAGDDPVFGADCGWIAYFPLHGPQPLNLYYRIGEQRKKTFDNRPGTTMDIEGELIAFDQESHSLYIDSGDARESNRSYSATVLVRI